MTLDEEVETEVRTLPLELSMSMMVEPEGPTVVPEFSVACAPENVTDPKLAKGTSPPFSSKSSTIHSASCSQRAYEEVRDLVTVLPVVTFSMTAVPAVLEVAVTVSLIVFPAEMGMPLKSVINNSWSDWNQTSPAT